jgi:hypothetical protein
MKQHKRGTPYPQDEPAFMVRPNMFTHGSLPSPVINPNIVLPHIYHENPALQSTMLVVDTLQHNNLDQVLADAPEEVRWRMRKTTETKNFSKKQVNKDIGKPGGNEKSPLQRVQNGALSMAEIVETMSLYQGLYHDRVCSGPNDIIKEVGERAQHARTPYGAILARDYLVALDRNFPARDIDPAIMQTAMKQINQSPAGQQYLASCPDINVASFAAAHRIRTQEQQALSPAIHPATPARRMR